MYPDLPPDAPLFTISVVSRVLSMHQQTVRNYERWGYIKPNRSVGGTRAYTQRDLERIRTIRAWVTELGLNRAGIKVMFELTNRINALEAEVRALRAAQKTDFEQHNKQRNEQKGTGEQ